MPLGTAVRHHLGPLEQPAASLYRRLFFNLDCFVERVLDAVPDPARILEIGCGEGDVATKLVEAYPNAQYLGIDPAWSVGRRYHGPENEAGFLNVAAATLAGGAPASYDLVLLVDVLHHVPDDVARKDLIRAATMLLRPPRGRLVIKEWEDDGSLAFRAGWFADRYISGDRQVRYMRRNDLMSLVDDAGPGLRHERTMWVHPWRCNGLHVYRSMGNLR